jgi:hypothetical protein
MKTTSHLSQDFQSAGWNLSPGPLEYEVGVLNSKENFRIMRLFIKTYIQGVS